MNKMLNVAAIVFALAIPNLSYASSDSEHGKKTHEILSGIPAEKAEAIRTALDKMREEKGESHDQMKKLHAEAKEILTAPEFNKQAFLEKTQEIEQKKQEMHSSFVKIIADNAGNLTQDERKILAKSMKKMQKSYGKKHHKE